MEQPTAEDIKPSTLPECKLSDEELILKVKELISKLCKTGGRAFKMSVPVRMEEDSDMLLCELVSRFSAVSKYKEELKQSIIRWEISHIPVNIVLSKMEEIKLSNPSTTKL